MPPVYKTLLAIVLTVSAFAAQAAGDDWRQDLQKGDWQEALEGATEAVNPATTLRRSRDDRRDRVRESGRSATPSSAPDRIEPDRRNRRETRRAGARSSKNAQHQIKRRARAGTPRSISRERIRRRSR